jgi:hypothetical protein
MGHLCSNERGPPAFMGRPSPQGVKKGLGLAPIFIWFGIMKRSAPLSSSIIRTSAALCHHPSAADTLGRHVKPRVDRPNAPQPPRARPQIEQRIVGLVSRHCGQPLPTAALMTSISRNFVARFLSSNSQGTAQRLRKFGEEGKDAGVPRRKEILTGVAAQL